VAEQAAKTNSATRAMRAERAGVRRFSQWTAMKHVQTTKADSRRKTAFGPGVYESQHAKARSSVGRLTGLAKVSDFLEMLASRVGQVNLMHTLDLQPRGKHSHALVRCALLEWAQ
jgi:hypothetical protein